MSTQFLISDSTQDMHDKTCFLFSNGKLQGVQSSFLLRPNMEQSGTLTEPQRLPTTQLRVDYGLVQDVTLLHELKQEFSEVIFRLTPIMKAKDAELYRHSLLVQSLALALTSRLDLPQADVFTIGLPASLHTLRNPAII